jgi:hypothetical protein
LIKNDVFLLTTTIEYDSPVDNMDVVVDNDDVEIVQKVVVVVEIVVADDIVVEDDTIVAAAVDNVVVEVPFHDHKG